MTAIVRGLSTPCTSTFRKLLARTALRAEPRGGWPEAFVPDEAVPAITGWLAVNCVPSLKVSRARSGLFSALNRCGSKEVVWHAAALLKPAVSSLASELAQRVVAIPFQKNL
jgi:hypothetical protein